MNNMWGGSAMAGGGWVRGSEAPRSPRQPLNSTETVVYNDLISITDTVNSFLLPALKQEFITDKTPRQITLVYAKDGKEYVDPTDSQYSDDIGPGPGVKYNNHFITNRFVCKPFTYGKIWKSYTNGLERFVYMEIMYFRKDYVSVERDITYKKGEYWLLYFDGTKRSGVLKLDSLEYIKNTDNHDEIANACKKNIHTCLQTLKKMGHHGTSHLGAWLAIEKLTEIVATFYK